MDCVKGWVFCFFVKINLTLTIHLLSLISEKCKRIIGFVSKIILPLSAKQKKPDDCQASFVTLNFNYLVSSRKPFFSTKSALLAQLDLYFTTKK